MATPGQLVEVTAKATGLSPVLVATYYKSLREAGIVTKSGRGRSAAKMTVDDAANLLLGLVSEQASSTASHLKIFRNLPFGGEILQSGSVGDEHLSYNVSLNKYKAWAFPYTETSTLIDCLKFILREEIAGSMAGRLHAIPDTMFGPITEDEAAIQSWYWRNRGYDANSARYNTSYKVKVFRSAVVAELVVERPYFDRKESAHAAHYFEFFEQAEVGFEACIEIRAPVFRAIATLLAN